MSLGYGPQQIGDGNPDGIIVGEAGGKASVYGVPPVVQRANAAQAAIATTAATSSSPYGYTSTQANAIIALVNDMRQALVDFGIIKGSA